MFQVNAVGDGGNLREFFLEDSVPLFAQLGPTPDRLVPHDGEVGLGGEVLGDRDGVVQVQDHVPVPAGDVDGFARVLNKFNL